MNLTVRPLKLKEANELVECFHRHHKPAHAHRFSIGALSDGYLVAAAIVARPVSRHYDQDFTCEVVRLVVIEQHKNACSFLYGACARIAKEMGFTRIQTYTLAEETGTSLRAAGWTDGGLRKSHEWNDSCGITRNNNFPTTDKWLWFREFK